MTTVVKKKSTPMPLIYAGVALALALASFGAYKLLIAPQRSEARELTEQIDAARTQLEQARTGGSEEPEDSPIRVADLFQLSRSMPDKPDLSNVLLQLSAIAGETGVTFQSIVPSDPQVVSSYRRIPIELVFEGHFYDLSDFLYRLRNLVGVHDGQLDAIGRLFSVESVSFEEGAQRFPQVRATLTVAAYAYGDGTQQPLPAQTQIATDAPPSAPPTDEGDEPIPPSPEGASAVGTDGDGS